MVYKSDLGTLVAAAVIPGASFAVGEQRVLFSIGEYTNGWQWRDYDVSPDGKRFVMIQSAGKPGVSLNIVENVFEELKARVKR